jgi:hypothetical protein
LFELLKIKLEMHFLGLYRLRKKSMVPSVATPLLHRLAGTIPEHLFCTTPALDASPLLNLEGSYEGTPLLS